MLEKEVSKTGSNLAALEKNVAKLEQTLGNSEASKFQQEKQQALLQAEQERLKENTTYLGSAIQDKISFQERTLMDEKVAQVEKSLQLLASEKEERNRRPYIVDEEFQRLGSTVSSVKESVFKSENQIKAILTQLEKMVKHIEMSSYQLINFFLRKTEKNWLRILELQNLGIKKVGRIVLRDQQLWLTHLSKRMDQELHTDNSRLKYTI